MIGAFFIGLLIGGYAGLLTAALLFASEDKGGGQ